MERANRLTGIDIMKLFMSVIVISMHTSLASEIDGVFARSSLLIVQKAAVPFFFICNGYFAVVSRRNNYKALCLRFAKMYAIWSVIYFPVDLMGGYTVLSYVRDIFLKGYHNYSWHLWYLLGLVYGFALLLLCKKLKISNREMHVIVIMMYIVGRMLTYCAHRYSGKNGFLIYIGAVMRAYFYSGRLLCAPLYLTIGIQNAKKEYEHIENSGLLLIILLVVSLMLDAICIENEISYVIMPIVFFKLAKRIKLPKSVIYKYLGRMSYWIYLWHMYFVYISVKVLKLSSTEEQFFVPLISVVFALIIVLMENKRIRTTRT